MSKESQSSRDARPRTRADLVEAIGRETRLQQAATDAIDELFSESVGINRTDVRCLDLLDLHGPMTAGELADRAGVTTGAVTAILDRMERAGLLRRVRDAADRRRVRVELTEQARRVASEFYAPIAAAGADVLMGYSVDELRLILDAVRRGRELSERFARELRERVPRRGLIDSVRAIADQAKAVRTEWAEEGRVLKRELKQQAAAIKRDAKELRRRPTRR